MSYFNEIYTKNKTTPPFHRYFMTEDKTDITLTSPITKGESVINVSAGHGFTGLGEYCLINYLSVTQQSKVISVTDNAITLASPFCCSIPVEGTEIIRGSIEMNVNGATTPVIFYCRPGTNATPIDVQHLHVFMRDGSDGDQSTYGGLSALTNGSFVQYTDGVDINLGIYKKNQDFVEFGGAVTYNEKAPSGEYSTDFSFDMLSKYGIVFRLDPALNGALTFTVQDNLTGLINHRVAAIGQTILT